MGQYVIPNSNSEDVGHLIHHAMDSGQWHAEMVWDGYINPNGVVFSDPLRTDQQCADLYSTWQKVANWQVPLPTYMQEHAPHLKQYLNASAPTNADSVHAIKDLIRAVYYLNSRLDV